MFSHVDLEELIKESLVPNGVESFTKIYETSIDVFLVVVDILIYKCFSVKTWSAVRFSGKRQN